MTKSVWGVGGDGWAYDIGYGGLDHVLASGENVNLLVLDTEVYSNTGGQMSKATPLAATAQFAAGGKRTPKKDLGMIIATYGTVYVAQVAFGANPQQTVRALRRGRGLPRPVARHRVRPLHLARHRHVAGARADAGGRSPAATGRSSASTRRSSAQGKNPLVIDSKAPTISFAEYAGRENRYRSLKAKDPALAEKLLARAEADVRRRWDYLQHLARWVPGGTGTDPA